MFARARNRRHAWELMDLGAQVMRETFHSSLEMGERGAGRAGRAAGGRAPSTRARFREHDERLLRAQYLVYDDEDALLQIARKEARRELEELFERRRRRRRCSARSPMRPQRRERGEAGMTARAGMTDASASRVRACR